MARNHPAERTDNKPENAILQVKRPVGASLYGRAKHGKQHLPHVRSLKVFINKFLRRIMRIRWPDRTGGEQNRWSKQFFIDGSVGVDRSSLSEKATRYLAKKALDWNPSWALGGQDNKKKHQRGRSVMYEVVAADKNQSYSTEQDEMDVRLCPHKWKMMTASI